MVKMRSVTSLL